LSLIYHDSQGEIWSPNGEARPLIEVSKHRVRFHDHNHGRAYRVSTPSMRVEVNPPSLPIDPHARYRPPIIFAKHARAGTAVWDTIDGIADAYSAKPFVL
jgi:hypothetical protein